MGGLRALPTDYEPAYALDLPQLTAFIEATQPDLVEPLSLRTATPTRHEFLSRLQGEITKSGIVNVLRKGIDHRQHHVDLFFPTPTPGNARAVELFAANRFTVTRQLHYSATDAGLSLDLAAFVNGLPVFTFELKNNITKQTFDDAVEQYKRDRDPRELIFQFGRCIAHFALDDQQVRFCTHLKGKQSWFLPFDKGWNDGAGNPPNPDGVKTDYLWRQILAPSEPGQHRRELRPDRHHKERAHRAEDLDADLPALPPARCRTEAPRRRRDQRCRPPLPHPALGWQRQVQLDRLARPPAHRGQARR